MASEEMEEELEKTNEALLHKVDHVKSMHGIMERNLRLKIEAMKAENLEQDIHLEQVRTDQIKKNKRDEGGAIIDIRRFDLYDVGKEKELHAWRDLFIAMLSSHDGMWEMILDEVEKLGKKVINEAELMDIQKSLTMESDVMNK